jgi:guanyl-specific ribonuclease Sa
MMSSLVRVGTGRQSYRARRARRLRPTVPARDLRRLPHEIAAHRSRTRRDGTRPAVTAFRWLGIALVAGMLALAWQRQDAPRVSSDGAPSLTGARAGDAYSQPLLRQGLPAEAIDTLRSVESGGPFPYDRDGSVFQNREGRLPAQPRGYYREYTVRTPGSRDRGARRIVAGGQPPAEFWYTDDHYRSFRRIEMPDP